MMLYPLYLLFGLIFLLLLARLFYHLKYNVGRNNRFSVLLGRYVEQVPPTRVYTIPVSPHSNQTNGISSTTEGPALPAYEPPPDYHTAVRNESIEYPTVTK